jgi:hypothetical protein
MDVQRERPPFSTITGTMIQLGARETVAIYCWDDLSWVAHFRDGGGELSDAAAWYRANAAWLRACHIGSKASLETITTLTPEMIERIGRLHRRTEERSAQRVASLMAKIDSFRRACGAMARRLQRFSARLSHRGVGLIRRVR